MKTFIGELESLPLNELKSLLESWERETLIKWLVNNDSNGIYKDADSLNEFGNILGKDEAIEIILNQIK